MEMTRSRRHNLPKGMAAASQQIFCATSGKRMQTQFFKLATIALLAFILLSSIFALGFSSLSKRLVLEPNVNLASRAPIDQGASRLMDDVYLGGLLAARPEGDHCHSRVQHHLYRKRSEHKPSAYLISKLRQYESLHHQCAQEAENFSQILASPEAKSTCQFVVWVSYSGLGNKLVTLAAAFLYALITNRVLLVDKGTDMGELFCEPFPGASWLLPSNFPHDWLLGLNESSKFRFGHLIDRGKCLSDVIDISSFPNIAYIHLTHTYNIQDRRFFCDAEQNLLRQVPWLFMKANNYFVPSFYFMPSFRAELEQLFPVQESIFHHLGRYLLHPSNSVWARTSRYYDAYLADAETLVGLQLRTFDGSNQALKLFSDQVLECVLENKILPNVTYNEEGDELNLLGVEDSRRSISVLITSLQQVYYERLRDLYVRFPAEDLSRVKVHLPSHEGFQKTDTAEHDKKALMEIYLLSLSDVLVTSPMSTFGYAAQGLAGVKPWVLRRLEEGNSSEPACSRVLSLDPCFHAPPLYDCDCRGGRDPGKILPIVKHCQDVHWGIQLAH